MLIGFDVNVWSHAGLSYSMHYVCLNVLKAILNLTIRSFFRFIHIFNSNTVVEAYVNVV